MISFIPSKSNFVLFTESRHHDTIFYYNIVDYHFQDQVKHLGMQFSYNLCDLSSINSLRDQISLCCNSPSFYEKLIMAPLSLLSRRGVVIFTALNWFWSEILILSKP